MILKLRLTNKINEMCRKNVILNVFTKEYKNEILYREILNKNVDIFKLNDNSEEVSEVIKRLKKVNFKNNFEMSTKEGF